MYPTEISRKPNYVLRLFLMIFLILQAAFAMCSAVCAKSEDKVVRVGWYESPFNTTDQFGRKSGYAYEYQQKIAAYTGWTYEYVEGSWLELFHKLEKGEIDLMSDVSYTAQRAENILYPSIAMGTEAYYIFITPENGEIVPDDVATLNGKKIGVTNGSIQEGIFKDWAKEHAITVELAEMDCSETESIEAMQRGELDAFITLDAYEKADTAVPVCKIGSSDYYFVVSKDRQDLLAELDAALIRIRDENRFYNLQLFEKYLRGSGSNQYLSVEEKAWLDEHGTIRVGYQDNYLAFCASDPSTGELTGALKDYLAYAGSCMENAQIEFEAVAYPTAAAAVEALGSGEVDCMFPANFTDYDGEEMGVIMTPTLMSTEMDAVVRASDQKEFIHKKDVTVAVNEGNPNYDMFLVDHYPGWKTVYYKDTPACLDAVAAGEADCIIISNYRFSNIFKQCEKLHLTTVSTDVDLDYCFAIPRGETELYSILAKAAAVVPESAINASLTYYSTEDVKLSFWDILIENLAIVMAVITAVMMVILILSLRSIRAERKAREEEKLVDELNRRVYVDALTSVRNKGAYADYMHELQKRVDSGEVVRFAIGVFDCDDLKSVNDMYGHDKGDVYLKAASRVICHVFQHSPVFRIGGDEFVVVLQNEDLENMDELLDKLHHEKETVSGSAHDKWDEVHVSHGIAVYDPQIDHSVDDVARRADKIMYVNKHESKRGR